MKTLQVSQKAQQLLEEADIVKRFISDFHDVVTIELKTEDQTQIFRLRSQPSCPWRVTHFQERLITPYRVEKHKLDTSDYLIAVMRFMNVGKFAMADNQYTLLE